MVGYCVTFAWFLNTLLPPCEYGHYFTCPICLFLGYATNKKNVLVLLLLFKHVHEESTANITIKRHCEQQYSNFVITLGAW